MRKLALRQVWNFSRLFSWNHTPSNGVGRPACNGNLNSHIVTKTAMNVNVLYKCLTKTIYNDEEPIKNNAANYNVASKTVETVSVFTILLKQLMKTRLHEILNKITSEPQSIFEYVSWKMRELLLSAIIATDVTSREASGAGAPDSCLHRCTSSLSGYLFARHPMYSIEHTIKSYLARSVTSGAANGFFTRSHSVTPCGEIESMEHRPCDKASSESKGTEVSMRDKLIKPICDRRPHTTSKVTVVGIGQVGIAAIMTLITQGVTNQIAMIDTKAGKLEGEALDLLHGSIFVNNPKIQGSTDYAISEGSRICIICAGVRQRDKETRLDLVQRNTDVLRTIIPELVKHAPDAVYIIATNPVDVLGWVAWKISGLPQQRVIGSGTLLDSARFRYMIARKLDVDTTSVDAYIIGEHGNSMVPVWSSVSIGGVRLRDLNPLLATPQDPEKWRDIHPQLLKAAYNVRTLKGFTSWAVGLSIARIVYSMLADSGRVFTMSTCVKGMQGVEDDIYLSLPAVLCHEGVSGIIHQALSVNESKQFLKSAKLMADIVKDIKL